MLDLDDATDVPWLSSVSPSSESVVVLLALDSDLAVAALLVSRALPSDDSCRNCSKKDIWLLGRCTARQNIMVKLLIKNMVRKGC